MRPLQPSAGHPQTSAGQDTLQAAPVALSSRAGWTLHLQLRLGSASQQTHDRHTCCRQVHHRHAGQAGGAAERAVPGLHAPLDGHRRGAPDSSGLHPILPGSTPLGPALCIVPGHQAQCRRQPRLRAALRAVCCTLCALCAVCSALHAAWACIWSLGWGAPALLSRWRPSVLGRCSVCPIGHRRQADP